MSNKQLLALYFGFGFLYLLASVFHIGLLANIAKLSLIPIVFFNYYFHKNKLEVVPIVLLVSCFLGDVFSLYLGPISSRFFLACFGIHHLVFTAICYKAIRDFDAKKLIFSAVPVVVLWFIYFNYSIKDIFGSQMGDLYPFVLAYSIVLSAFTITSLVNYFNNETKVNLYPVMVAVCFLIGDITLAIDNFLVELFFFDFTTVVVKVVAYLFLLRLIKHFDFKHLY
ncbi:lysoplasmalogenase family protein [Joostella sp. CR20]|uniref:lysoplasmalogenase family protein n=1 Tax=Joostella sp. CR20 TaxID=2804312 RepID=UPI00313F064C